jgi:hypothetical protein
MPDRVREFLGFLGLLRENSRRTTVAAVLAAAGLAALFAIRGTFGRSEAAAVAADRVYVCAETGRPFRHAPARGESPPVKSPYTGRQTGYPAELCYWTADGRTKKEPIPVLLNTYRGLTGPTFCPDCGRLVVAHNPYAAAGAAPPPTRQQYEARAKSSGSGAPRVARE